MIVTSKAELQNYLFSLAGNIYNDLTSELNKRYDFTIEYYIDQSDDSAEIIINAHDTDDLEWAREQNHLGRW